MYQTTARFGKLKPNQIKEFRFQTRPYEWVEFRNVSLASGQTTNVEISAAPPAEPASSPPAAPNTPTGMITRRYTFDDDKNMTLSAVDPGIKVAVENGELRIQGKTTNTQWGEEGADFPVEDLGGELDVSVAFRIPVRTEYGLVYLAMYPDGETGPPMHLYQWQPKRVAWVFKSDTCRGWYQVHTMWLKCKWWLSHGRRHVEDLGTEEKTFATMRMRLRGNRRQIDYYLNGQAMDTLNLDRPLGKVSRVHLGFQTPKRGETYDVRFDNLAIQAGAPSGETAESAPPAPSAPKKGYSFRTPSYSLRQEPQRVPPRTLSQKSPAPAEAIVFNRPIRWWSSHWSGRSKNTHCAAMVPGDEYDRFLVTQPGKRKVWVKYFDVPIDPQRYPLAVLTYRATGTHPEAGDYALYLDDTSGPDYGGLLPFAQRDLVADGKEHVLTCDLRPLQPIGDLIGLAVGVYASPTGPAEFDLIDLRFESTETKTEPIRQAETPLRVCVVDSQNAPLLGATVAVDAERRNWAQSAKTDASGMAEVRPFVTQTGRHMIRVTREGYLPVEIREVVPNNGSDFRVSLEPASAFRGTVMGDDKKTLPGATVYLRTAGPGNPSPWTRRDAEAITDAQGHWESAPLSTLPLPTQLRLSHPEVSLVPWSTNTHTLSSQELSSGSLVLTMQTGRATYEMRIQDSAGRPIPQASVRSSFCPQPRRLSDEQGQVTVVGGSKRGDLFLVRHPQFAPALASVPQETGTGPMVVSLSPPQSLQGRVLDAAGEPLAGVRLQAFSHRIPSTPIATFSTDSDGRFMWATAPDWHVELRLEKAGYSPKSIRVTAGEKEQEIRLQPAGAPKSRPTAPRKKMRRRGYDPWKIFRRLS